MSLAGNLKKQGVKKPPKRTGPMWAGPESDAENGGVTFSLLPRFLTCRERFRLRVIEGIKPVPKFDKYIEFGNMWHVCEEQYAQGGGNVNWSRSLKLYVMELCGKYRTQQEEIEHWYNTVLTEFPLYAEWWSKHPDVKDRTPLLQEQVFKVRYTLPSGRTVFLRGKWDSVDLVGNKKNGGIWLMENKTKGEIDEPAVARQLSFDLQTMLYMVALHSSRDNVNTDNLLKDYPIQGVRYNVIRRPFAMWSKGNIKRKEPSKSNPAGESAEDFYNRLSTIIENAHGSTEQGQEWGLQKGQHYFFMRWNVKITQQDIERFKVRTLNPILEQLCDWYQHVTTANDPFDKFYVGPQVGGAGCEYATIHWQHPFGSVNTIDEYGETEIDEYMLTGSETGLVRNAELFEELK